MLEELDKIPSDSRSQIGFLCYDSSLYFFNLEESLSQPQMLIVSDVEGMLNNKACFYIFKLVYG